MKQKVLFLMLLLLLGLAGGSVMAGEPVVERQAGMKIKPGNGSVLLASTARSWPGRKEYASMARSWTGWRRCL